MDVREIVLKHKDLSNREIEKRFGISRFKVSQIKKELGITPKKKTYTQKEIEIIISQPELSSEELSKQTGIPASTIRGIRKKYGVRPRKFFNPDKEEFVKLYKQMKSSRELAKYYGVEKTTILNFAKKIGLSTERQPILSPEEIDFIVNNYHTMTSTELADKFNCSIGFITKIWHDHGLRGKERRIYKLKNQDYFAIIDSPAKAYFLGLIASDGCVHTKKSNTNQDILLISLKSYDKYILNVLKNELGLDKPIRHNQSNDTVTIEVVSDKICSDLKKYNITPNKTWTFKPNNISDKYMSHFIRGYFDGDGCITTTNKLRPSDYSISIVGNKECMQYISNYLKKININNRILQDKRKEKYANEFYTITLVNSIEKYSFLKYIYNDAGDFCLSRKKEKALYFIQLIESNFTKRAENIRAINHFKKYVRCRSV